MLNFVMTNISKNTQSEADKTSSKSSIFVPIFAVSVSNYTKSSSTLWKMTTMCRTSGTTGKSKLNKPTPGAKSLRVLVCILSTVSSAFFALAVIVGITGSAIIAFPSICYRCPRHIFPQSCICTIAKCCAVFTLAIL